MRTRLLPKEKDLMTKEVAKRLYESVLALETLLIKKMLREF
jgi:hypothetical protein